ncbi:hypothetical protein GN278_06575 [Rhodobacteraceae bacterium Araon29]
MKDFVCIVGAPYLDKKMSEMGSENTLAVLRQKISPSQPQVSPADKVFEKSLHKALSQSALQLFGLKLQISDHRICYEPVSRIAKITEPFLMLGLLESSAKDSGFVALDRAALSNLVTFQTLGCILPELSQSRTATLTDAALIAPLIEQTMQKLQDIGQTDFGLGQPTQYRFSQMFTDAHRVSLAMQSEQFITYHMDLAMGDSRNPAKILIAFPTIEQNHFDRAAVATQKRDASQQVFLSLPTQLNAELHCFRFAWSELSQLKVGKHLFLPDTALENIHLKATHSSEFISAKLGRLGQFRAVQVDITDASTNLNLAKPNSDLKSVNNHKGETNMLESKIPNNSCKSDLPKTDALLGDEHIERAETPNVEIAYD